MSQPAPQPQANNPQPNNKAVQPKFGGLIPAEAFTQFLQDTAGVWLPKAPVSLFRNTQGDKNNPTAQKVNKIQFFEDTFLEFVEDGAFYFTIPVMGTAMAAAISKIHKGLGFASDGAFKDIGKSWAHTIAKDGTPLINGAIKEATVPTKLVAAKSSAVVGALASAFAFEYMIQHWKNVITAKKFKTANFTGVAGLESSRTQIFQGEDDPVAKASKRGKQVGALWLATVLGAAFVMPRVIQSAVKSESMKIPKLLRYFNFGSALPVGKKEGMQFDTTKAFQGVLTLVGLASYLDAARDKLEFKEQATRLSVVIPYLLFGQASAKNLLAKGIELIPFKGTDGKSKSVADYGLSLVDRKEGSIWKAMGQKVKTPETFLQLDVVKGAEQFAQEVQQKVDAGLLTQKAANTIKSLQNRGLFWSSLGLGALVCGVGINLIAYRQTNKRHEKQEVEKQKKMTTLQPAQPPQGRTVFQSYGGFAAQGKPLEDPASAAAIAAPRVQAPFQGARPSTNPYGYGQWRI
jgi:hypothetical protein